MKALRFSNQLKDAGIGLAMVGASEPTVVVRHGLTGAEIPLAAVKFRKDRNGESKIILEVA